MRYEMKMPTPNLTLKRDAVNGVIFSSTFSAPRPLASRWASMKLLALCLLSFASCAASASPCDGVDRSLSANRKSQLAPVIAKQLNVESAEILQSYRYRGWYIIYVGTHVSDEAFLFFSGDPTQGKYLTTWGGGAAASEEPEIKQWVLKNAKGIPPKLAGCFAWHVTKDRDL